MQYHSLDYKGPGKESLFQFYRQYSQYFARQTNIMSKNIRSFFAPRSSASVSHNHSDSEGSDIEPPAPKKRCQGLTSQASSSQGSLSTKRRHYLKRWKVIFLGWNMMKIFKVLSVSTVKSGGSQILKLAGHGSLSLLATGRKP